MKTTKCQTCDNECFIVYGDNIMKCSRCGEQWGITSGIKNNHCDGGRDSYACILNYHDFERIIFTTAILPTFNMMVDIPKHIRRSIGEYDASKIPLPKYMKFFLDYEKSDFDKKILYYYSEEDYRRNVD